VIAEFSTLLLIQTIPVAVGAFAGRVFVDDDFLACRRPRLVVALCAGHIGVGSGQGKRCFRVVVEGRGRPALRNMTICAVGQILVGQELSVVDILVTGLALRWRAGES
jgi:hypothetical protein